MAYLLKFGGKTIGTELMYELPRIERTRRSIVHSGIGHANAAQTAVEPAKLWVVRFVVYHEESTTWAFARWVYALGNLMDGTKRDVTLWENSTLKRTIPNATFERIDTPEPRSPVEARFSGDVRLTFQTDERPY